MFKHKGPLVWFAAFSNHCSLFPTASVIEAFKNELKRDWPTIGPEPALANTQWADSMRADTDSLGEIPTFAGVRSGPRAKST